MSDIPPKDNLADDRAAGRHLLTLDDLTARDLTPADVRDRCPGAVERIDLDGRPCWLQSDLLPLLDGKEAQR